MDDEILEEKKSVRTIKIHNGTTVTVGAINSAAPSLEMLKMLADKLVVLAKEDEIKFGLPDKLLISDFQLDIIGEKPKKEGQINKKLCKQIKPIPINKGFNKPTVNPRKRGKW